MTRPRLELRATDLVLAILHTIHDAEAPIPWTELVDLYSDTTGYSTKTIENTLHDLAAYGAIQRIGTARHGHHPDTRALRPTTLGRAWLNQTIPPLPKESIR